MPEESIVTELTIPRKEWLHGEGNEASSLLRPSDCKRCCLGHYLKACGLKDQDLQNFTAPSQLEDAGITIPDQARWLLDIYSNSYSTDSNHCFLLMLRNDNFNNDNPEILYSNSDKEIEEGIISLFLDAPVPIRVTFVD